MNKTQKAALVTELQKELTEATTLIVTHYKGLNVDEMTKLRRRLREAGAKFKVAKNSLMRKAIEETNYQQIKEIFTGPTAVAYSQDPVSIAKIMVESNKENKNIIILCGVSDGKRIEEEEIRNLATLPSLDQLRGKIIGLLNAPATKIAGVLQAPAGQLARVLGAYSEKSK